MTSLFSAPSSISQRLVSMAFATILTALTFPGLFSQAGL